MVGRWALKGGVAGTVATVLLLSTVIGTTMPVWAQSATAGSAVAGAPGTSRSLSPRFLRTMATGTEGVRERARPDYDARGLPAGAARIFPSLRTGILYNDNIFAAPAGEVDDLIFNIAPAVLVETTWSRHRLYLDLASSSEFYADNENENRTDFEIEGGGRVDIQRGTSMQFSGFFRDLTENRISNLTQRNTREPVTFTVAGGEGSISHEINRVRLQAGASFTSFDFDDAVIDDPGGPLDGAEADQDVRDKDVWEAEGRVDYAVSPDTSLFVTAGWNTRDFDLPSPMLNETTGVISLVDRDSQGFDVGAGARFRVTRLIEGELFGGYQDQDYDSPSLPGVAGFDYGVALNWFLTPLTTVRLEGSSDIVDATAQATSALVRRSIQATVDHELLPNVLLQVSGGYADDDYEPSIFESTARQDERYFVGGRVDYLVNRNVSVFGTVDYLDQDSNIPVNSFDQTLLFFGIELKV